MRFIICRLQHENLVDMVGFSCDGQYPCVIYPLMSNGSLLDRLACLVSPVWLQMLALVAVLLSPPSCRYLRKALLRCHGNRGV